MVDNSGFMKDFLRDFTDPTKSNKTLGDAIGLPDKEDEEFILKLIKEYESHNPGWLGWVRDQARDAYKEGRYGQKLYNDDGTVNKASAMTYDFELPVTFVKKIEDHYPLMFRDVNHYRWFKNMFVNLMIVPNTKRKPKKNKK